MHPKTTNMEIKHIIFDFDGTLMDTAPVILATMAATIKEMGLPERTEEQCRETIGKRLEDIPEMLFPDVPNISTEYAATYRRIFELENRPGVAKPFPGVIDTLRSLHSFGFSMAIASSRNSSSLQKFVDDLELTDLFCMLIGGDNVAEAKPAPEPVYTICRKMGWQMAETLVVGDATYDIMMGRNAGCPTCAVTYGNQSRSQLMSVSPDFILDSFAELGEQVFNLPYKKL